MNKLAADSTALSSIEPGDSIKGAENLYREPLRGQLHFSPRRGWNNDPNGMVFSQGEYHMYLQHNPYGYSWGNMHWGHAVSSGMVHWQELPEAIQPHAPGDKLSGGTLKLQRVISDLSDPGAARWGIVQVLPLPQRWR